MRAFVRGHSVTSYAAATHPRIAIVGGGVAGLATALALARYGIPSQILEARSQRGRTDKGDVLHESSIRMLADWGLYELLINKGALALPLFHVLDDQGIVKLVVDFAHDLDPPARVLSLRHAQIEEVLEGATAATGIVRVVRGRPVRDLIVRENRVAGVLTSDGAVEADLVVLAHGRYGRLGRRFFTQRYEHDYSVRFYNLRVLASIASGSGTYVLSKHGLLVLVPLPNGEMRLGIQMRHTKGDRALDVVELREIVRQRLKTFPIDSVEIVSVESYPLVSQFLASFWKPGVAVVGDAAHTVHPAGGQGMNLALRDADTFSKALSKCVDAGWSHTAMDRSAEAYSRDQVASTLPVFKRTHLLGVLGGMEGWWAAAVAALACKALGRSRPLRRRVFTQISEVR